MSHTPGPWIYFEDIGEICTVDEFGEMPICEMWKRANSKANAHLIAAAPELLEALEQIARLYEHYQDTGTTSQIAAAAYDMRCIARTAIAKAKGQSS